MAADWISYFKMHPAYEKLFIKFKEKYESLGKTGGSISLSSFTADEIKIFALFLGIPQVELMKKGKIFLQPFEKCLTGRKFPELTLHQLLEQYFGCDIRGKRAVADEEELLQKEIMASCREKYPKLISWFDYLEKRTPDTFWIWGLVRAGAFEKEAEMMHKAYQNLPSELERYPLFSQRITGDPHRFDFTTVTGRLFLHLLQTLVGVSGSPPKNTEGINELLLRVNLLRDDINNFVTLANMIGIKNHAPHPVWQAAVNVQTVLNIPLRELLPIDRVALIDELTKVFVVENSGVFSSLNDRVPTAPLICTHGQFKLAGLRLLDLLAKAGYLIYYSGDFDPEGISMALRLFARYKEQFRFWRFSACDYYATNPTVLLGERKKKFDSLKGSVLDELIEVIENVGKIGYQEGIVKQLSEDLFAAVEGK